jgi:hypothetical protein
MTFAPLYLPKVAPLPALFLVLADDPCHKNAAVLSALATYRENPMIAASIAAAVEANGTTAVREWFNKKFPTET